jgi:plasmid stabilization system protein ParE
MATIRISAEARADLADIWDHLAERSPRAADTLLDAFAARIETLRSHPKRGHPRPDLRRGLRCTGVRGYLIFYLTRPHAVGIARILHHSRDAKSVLTPTSPP